MGYIKLLNDNQFIFCKENLYENMVQINEDMSKRYLQEIQSGKVFKLININGSTFEELFEEVVPIETPKVPNLEERLAALETLMMGVI